MRSPFLWSFCPKRFYFAQCENFAAPREMLSEDLPFCGIVPPGVGIKRLPRT